MLVITRREKKGDKIRLSRSHTTTFLLQFQWNCERVSMRGGKSDKGRMKGEESEKKVNFGIIIVNRSLLLLNEGEQSWNWPSLLSPPPHRLPRHRYHSLESRSFHFYRVLSNEWPMWLLCQQMCYFGFDFLLLSTVPHPKMELRQRETEWVNEYVLSKFKTVNQKNRASLFIPIHFVHRSEKQTRFYVRAKSCAIACCRLFVWHTQTCSDDQRGKIYYFLCKHL